MHWIFAHLIGDYLIQTDWMAEGKKHSSLICTIHVLTYLIPFLFCINYGWQWFAIGIEHFIQDRTSIVVWLMKKKGSARFAEPPMAPWSIILTDNILHVLFIAFVMSF